MITDEPLILMTNNDEGHSKTGRSQPRIWVKRYKRQLEMIGSQLDFMTDELYIQQQQRSGMSNICRIFQSPGQQITQSITSLSPPPQLERWKVGKFLGGGASGRVYKALNVLTMQTAAVKQIPYIKQTQSASCEEIKVLLKLNHPNIVRYIQHFHFDHSQETWIFIEYVPHNLQTFYKEYGAPPLRLFLNFSKQLTSALDYLHRNKVVHKDVKCQNVLLDDKGVLKLTDYGSSKCFDRSVFLNEYERENNKTLRGTTHWMAPESILEGQYTRKSDVWNLGCTLLQLATTKKPWSETNIEDERIIYYIGTTNDTPKIPNQLHKSIVQILEGCLKRKPQERLSTEELIALINSFQQ